MSQAQQGVPLTDDERIARGNRAKQVLDYEGFHEAIAEIRTNLHSGLDHLSTDDTDTAMAMIRQIRALRVIVGKLESWAQEARRLQL